MVQLWSALATRDTRLMTYVLGTHFPTVLTNAIYATYARSHDDIGWAVTDEDARAVGLSGPSHRAFLADFYEGVFPGSFATGELFQYNPESGDKRNSGTFASLAGLERAEAAGDRAEADAAADRILMGHALIASFGGVPLVYMGNEIALLNDHGDTAVSVLSYDSRWLHRPAMDWGRATAAEAGEGAPGRVLAGVRHILARRAATTALHGANPTVIADTGRPELFAFVRQAPTGPLVCFFNFTESWTTLRHERALSHGCFMTRCRTRPSRWMRAVSFCRPMRAFGCARLRTLDPRDDDGGERRRKEVGRRACGGGGESFHRPWSGEEPTYSDCALGHGKC